MAAEFIGNTGGGTAFANLNGVALYGGASGNLIGGTTALAASLIDGNRDAGVSISGAGTSGNTVEGNYLGLGASGAGPLGNRNGVVIDGTATPATTSFGTRSPATAATAC